MSEPNIDIIKMLGTTTHVPILVHLVLHTTGDILEFSCGYYSTLLLHELACANKRRLLTLESNKEWFDHFKCLQNEWHKFELVNDWEQFTKPLKQNWDVVFIDHAPALRRKEDIIRLKDKAEYIVVHDSNESLYQYNDAFNLFKYRFDYTLFNVEPSTTVLSNKNNLEFLEKYYENCS